MKHYCIVNGCEITFSGIRPNFCPICGSAQSAAAKKPAKAPVYVDEDEEPEVGEYDVETLSSLISVTVKDSSNNVKLGSIAGSGGEEIGPKRPKMTKKEFKEQLEWVKATNRLPEEE